MVLSYQVPVGDGIGKEKRNKEGYTAKKYFLTQQKCLLLGFWKVFANRSKISEKHVDQKVTETPKYYLTFTDVL